MFQQRRAFVSAAVLSIALALSACSGMSHKEDQAMKPASLYDRLGGKPAITAVVDDFVANVAGDNRINGRFAATDIPKLKKNLVDQICNASGGPCAYTGRDMKTSHKGMRIQEAEFNALVEDLVKSLNKFKVGKTEQGELLGALGSMKGDIVNQ